MNDQFTTLDGNLPVFLLQSKVSHSKIIPVHFHPIERVILCFDAKYLYTP